MEMRNAGDCPVSMVGNREVKEEDVKPVEQEGADPSTLEQEEKEEE